MGRLRRRLRVLVLDLKALSLRFLIRNERFWRFARRFKPILVLPPRGIVWVSRHEDVIDVLTRDRDFAVPYLPNLEGLRSPFLLGLPDGDDYERQLDALVRALRHPQLPPLVDLSMAEARRALASCNGTIDVVGDLTERVLTGSVGAYLGTGRVTPAQLEQSRAIFREVFINSLGDDRVTAQAVVAGKALRAHIAAVVADRRAASAVARPAGVDVLSVLLAGGKLSDDELVNSLLGLFVGWTTPVSRSMGFAIDALLQEDERIRIGHDAALSGRQEPVREVMREALRFKPSAPALERVCLRATKIGGRDVARGTRVMALVCSAMMDDASVDEPRRFTPGRNGAANLHFGYEVHRCIGEHISMAQIAAISSVLLAHENVRPVGSLKLTGPFPSKLLVGFGPSAA
ncbi:MAG TPA: cytochrome P450 [Solirubrobacteraceae bacterium]|jgi:cytochrome P450|nr:cytochrome P450 [Solirubrobacteraceae bacterium]